MTTPLKRGAVIEYPAMFSFESYARPYVIISGDAHPFYGQEYVGLAVTTSDLPAAVKIPADAWTQGGLPQPSFVKPWQPILLKHDDIIDAFGLLDRSFVDRAVAALGDVIDR